ncbi:MAG: hypothetical protein LUD50_03970 [Clostridia bacterium]|nr:hypothetical protein [Clostridia bacterium]
MKEKAEMKASLDERKRNQAVDEMLSGMNEASDAAEQQMETHYQKMLMFAEKKDFKQAKWHARMYQFMDRLSQICRRYAGLIQDQAAMAQMFGALRKMNKNFSSFMKITSAGAARSAVRNLKKFGKRMARFDNDIDRMMAGIDSIFDDPKAKKKKNAQPEVDDEQSFLDLVGKNKDLADRFAGEPGGEAVLSHEPGAGGETGGTPGVVPPVSGRGGIDNPFNV